MRICFGWSKIPLCLSPERRYVPEQLQRMLAQPSDQSANPLVSMPLWIHVDGEHIRLNGKVQVWLACQLACVYHNGPDCLAPPDDGWDQDTLMSEERAAQHMIAEGSDEETDTVDCF